MGTRTRFVVTSGGDVLKRVIAEYDALSNKEREIGIDVDVPQRWLSYVEEELDKVGIAHTRVLDDSEDPQCLSLASRPEHLKVRERAR